MILIEQSHDEDALNICFFACSESTILLRWNSTGIVVAGQTNIRDVVSDQLNMPYGLVLDSLNSLYVADTFNNRIQKFSFGSKNGTTVAGQNNGIAGSSSTQLNLSIGIMVDSHSKLFISDSNNHCLQLWMYNSYAGITIVGTSNLQTSENLIINLC